MRHTIALPLLLAAIIGCGDDNSAGSFNADDDARYTEEQVAERAGFTRDDTGISWNGPDDCQISVILTTRGAIDLYAGAGDAVVTNPAGDIGVKFHTDPGCRETLLAALERVP